MSFHLDIPHVQVGADGLKAGVLWAEEGHLFHLERSAAVAEALLTERQISCSLFAKPILFWKFMRENRFSKHHSRFCHCFGLEEAQHCPGFMVIESLAEVQYIC